MGELDPRSLADGLSRFGVESAAEVGEDPAASGIDHENLLTFEGHGDEISIVGVVYHYLVIDGLVHESLAGAALDFQVFVAGGVHRPDRLDELLGRGEVDSTAVVGYD